MVEDALGREVEVSGLFRREFEANQVEGFAWDQSLGRERPKSLSRVLEHLVIDRCV